jgi:transposase
VEHIGIDLGARHSHVVVMSPKGTVVARRKMPTVELGPWLGTRAASRVVMEACTQSSAIAAASRAQAHSTIVVPGAVVRALGVGARGIKTDDRDAEVLARASVRNEELPSVHIRSARSQAWRELLTARALLVKSRAAFSRGVKSWLRGRLVVLRGRADHRGWAEAVRESALKHRDGLPAALEALLKSFEGLSDQLAELDKQIEAIVDKDPVCERLQAIPGVGPVVSLAFTAQLDDPGRFGSSDELSSYLALVPGENTTGGKVKRTGMIKAGPAYLKTLLVQAAWSMWRSRPNDAAVVWARGIGARRGKRIAIVALARKLATVMWSMWKHGTTYDPARAARPTTSSTMA